MFIKFLIQDIISYFQRLWPFALAVIAVAVLAFLGIKFDTNTVEATFTVTVIGFYIMASVAYFITLYAVSFCIYSRSLKEKQFVDTSSVYFISAKVIATTIYALLGFILIFAGAALFAFDWIINIVQSFFGADWIYLIQLVAFLAIIIPLIHLALALIKTTYFCGKHGASKALIVIFIVILSFILTMLAVLEPMLLIHSETTNMQDLWLTMCFLLSVCLIFDIFSFWMTAKMLNGYMRCLKSTDFADRF